MTADEARRIHEKLDKLLAFQAEAQAFQAELKPYVPLLVSAAKFLENPAAKYRAAMASRRASKAER